MYDKHTWQFWIFLLLAWILFPLTAVWLILTHPGRCALITKWVLVGWPNTANKAEEKA